MSRPRLSEARLREQVAAYCRRFKVRPGANGLPPYPAGRREDPKHRAWIKAYKAWQRLSQ